MICILNRLDVLSGVLLKGGWVNSIQLLLMVILRNVANGDIIGSLGFQLSFRISLSILVCFGLCRYIGAGS